MVNCIKISEIMQVTRGMFEVALLSFKRSSKKGAKKFFIMEAQREATSWVALEFGGGRLSGMVSNRKSGKPSKEFVPLDSRKYWWLNSMLWA